MTTLKWIKRMLIGLGLATATLLLCLIVEWKNPRLSEFTWEQVVPLAAVLTLLLWCVITFEMVENVEDKFTDQAMELRRLQKKRAA